MTTDEDFEAAVLAASRALLGMAVVSIDGASTDVTLSQFRALVLLATRGPLTMSTLATSMRLSPSSATRLVDRLEPKDLATRRPSPTSRRAIELCITTRGAALVTEVMEARHGVIRGIVSRIPGPRRAAMLQAFEEFAVAAGEPVDWAPEAWITTGVPGNDGQGAAMVIDG